MLNRFTQHDSIDVQESKDLCNKYSLVSKPWFLIFIAVLMFTALQVNTRKFNNDTPPLEPLELSEEFQVVKQKNAELDPFEDQASDPQNSPVKNTMVLKLDRFNVQLHITVEPLTN